MTIHKAINKYLDYATLPKRNVRPPNINKYDNDFFFYKYKLTICIACDYEAWTEMHGQCMYIVIWWDLFAGDTIIGRRRVVFVVVVMQCHDI